jgi:hypothetical protein
LRQLVGNPSSDGIERSTGREWNDQPDRFRWKRLRHCLFTAYRQRSAADGERERYVEEFSGDNRHDLLQLAVEIRCVAILISLTAPDTGSSAERSGLPGRTAKGIIHGCPRHEG